MDKQSVIRFFDRLAPEWDAEMVRSDEIIGVILDNANVTEGKHVLDVACGTGVLIPDYRKRRAASAFFRYPNLTRFYRFCQIIHE